MKMRQTLTVLVLFALLFANRPSSSASADVLKILNPTPDFDDRFGKSLTVVGDNILVGVENDDTVATAFTQYDGGPLAAAGAAYLMDGTTGGLLQTYFSPVTDPAGFGGTVASTTDNNILVHGSDKNSGKEWGKLFYINAMTGELLQTYETPDSNYYGIFGRSVAVQGNNLLVGAPISDVAGPVWAGAAYLIDATTGNVLQTFLPPTPTRTHKFGSEVALAGDNVVIGTVGSSGTRKADEVHVFSASTGALLHTLETPGADFRPRLATDGNNILVGDSSFDGSTGVAYLFDAPTGELLHTFLNPTPERGDRFGTSVAIRGDKVLLGANADDTLGLNSGAAYLFDADTGDLLNTFLRTEPGDIGSYAGFAHSQVGFLGDRIIVGDQFDNTGAERAGAVYVFDVPKPSLAGDCNADGSLDAADLTCVGTIEDRNAVLGALNTLPGDLDGDGAVGFSDFLVLSANFGNETATYAEGNIDLAGGVGFTDFLALSANFGHSAETSAVPEPSGFALTGLAVLGIECLHRRRK